MDCPGTDKHYWQSARKTRRTNTNAASTFEIMFWRHNIGDKLYVAYAYDTGATRLGDPRNWGVTVRKSF
jgi:hypothetical protein